MPLTFLKVSSVNFPPPPPPPSALQSLCILYPVRPTIRRSQKFRHSLPVSGTIVMLLWVSGHVGVSGNETAGATAKAAVSLPLLATHSVPSDDLCAIVARCLILISSSCWPLLQCNNLREIRPLSSVRFTSSRSPHCEVVTARLCVGHCRFSRRHLMCGDPAPLSSRCSQLLTVHHLLVQCPFFNCFCQNLCFPTELSDVLTDNPHCVVHVLHFPHHTYMKNEI